MINRRLSVRQTKVSFALSNEERQLNVATVAGSYNFCVTNPYFAGYKISGMKTKAFVTFLPPAHSCPAGQIYINCSNPQVDPELSRERTCENQLLNLTFSAHLPCVSGCVCPPGWVKTDLVHKHDWVTNSTWTVWALKGWASNLWRLTPHYWLLKS